MSKIDSFKENINTGYTFKGDFITIGGASLDGVGTPDTLIKIPLKTLNRHGLIAGATGTGKTKTLQVIAEQMSLKGIPTVLMDIKGDLSGLAAEGVVNDFITKRHSEINIPFSPQKMPVELMSMSNSDGVQLKASITKFGPVLLSKILDLNDTQSSVISLIFVYCKNNNLPLIDLTDLRKVLQYITNEGKEDIEAEYGQVSSSTINIIMRKIIELEQQGADTFFGEKSFETQDLVRLDENGNGIISIIRLMDIQNKPKLFSTFMLSLLTDIYNNFPEEGDSDKPKLCVFIDEAHLVFSEASPVLLDQLEVIIKLIRSKGIGIYFCTQNPIDIPDEILSQLGLKIQHALRAFTEKDRKAIVKASENYPISEFYETDEMITKLGIGEAFVTALNEKGIPTPLAVSICRAPVSRMDILSADEVKNLVSNSKLVAKYNQDIKIESAADLIDKKIKTHTEKNEIEEKSQESEKAEIAENKAEEKELKELQKAEEKRNNERERELERLRKEQIKADAKSKAENEKFIKDIAKAATSSRKSNNLIGLLIQWIIKFFSKK